MRFLRRQGVLDTIAQYQLGGVEFGVPLCRLQWDLWDVLNYEAELINAFCQAVDPLTDVVLFDCGADIGTFSALICARMVGIARIIAFEPNSDTQEFLRFNLSNLRVPFEIVPKAVSYFEGCGRLEQAEYDPVDHARFLVPGEGPLAVTTIDRMNVRNCDIAIKVDIEGGEVEALKGAAETIAAARQCVVAVEAHPTVANRTGRDPVECLQFLESVRPFDFLVAETGLRPATSGPILTTGQTAIWNVIGWTYGSTAT
jgi:FkbM family methyltransferase